ncbi:myb-like protein X [Liolophura sinensis]|uniref:myb-like protein X n=1 Tax=Liolophura sinensis TaxID=3198878 RepID=UPI00315952DF
MSEEVAISEVSSNGASISSPSQPAQSHRDSGISHTSLAEEAQRRTQAASVNSTSDSPLLPTIPSVAPPVDDISWDLGHYETGVAKNLLNDISEEQMSKLDEVLSLDEVQEFLQQTGSNSFPSEMSEAPPPDTASGLSAEDQATPLSDGDKLAGKTELFSSTGEPLKLEDLDLDDETAHEIIKKGIREQDVASIAVSFSDHAYALAPDKESKTTGAVAMATPPSTASPSAKTTTTPFSTPRKSSRIAKRKGIPLEESVKSEEETRTGTEDDGGKSAETEEETSRTDESEDGRKRLSEDEPTKGKGRGKKKVQAVPRPTRRSTRISEHEQREMAEKIRQENLRKEREEMDAMMKAKEEERLQEEDKKEKEKKEKEKQEKQEPEKASESEENVEEDSQQEVEEMEGVLTSVPQKPAGRGRGRGRKAGAKAEVKPGAKAVAKGVQKPRGRGRGRGKKAGTEESEAASQTQSSSTEDEVPLRTLTKKGRKVPKKGAKAVPSETPAPDTTDAKKKEADGPVGSDAEDSVPLGKLKTGTTKVSKKHLMDWLMCSRIHETQLREREREQIFLSEAGEGRNPGSNPDPGHKFRSEVPRGQIRYKTAEKKGSEDQKVKAVGIRQRRPTGRKSESEIQALSLASDLFKPDAVIVHQQTDEGRQPTGEAGCQADEESDGGLSYEDDENDSDWDPGENADKLWCICKKPHGNSEDNKKSNRKQ